MKVVIAPDKFKGCLAAAEVADALAAGVRRAAPHATLDLCPLADGGEGTVDALVHATGGTFHTATVIGPLPAARVDARFGLLPNHTAVIEMAAASGLALLPPDQRNPLRTTTYGTGELINAAVALGAKRIILGIGGSATTDGGLGCAQACGAKIYTQTMCSACVPLELHSPATGDDLLSFHSMTRPNVPADILVASDVTNPLFGPTGAAPIFAPQKGATPEMVRQLDAGLEYLATRTKSLPHAHTPGAGAAGGLGFALLAFFHATLRPGIDLVIEATHLRDRLAGTHLCLTGEGKLDTQSLSGKTPVGVARACHDAAVPCIAIAGAVDITPQQSHQAGFAATYPIAADTVPLEQRIRDAFKLLADTAERAVRHHTQ